jgi:hypothetical protein
MADAIAHVATLPGDTRPLLTIMGAIGSKVDIVNFEIAAGLKRVTAMLRTGGTVTIRMISVSRPRATEGLCLQFRIPSNFRDYEILYFGALRPDGGVAIHAIRSRDLKNEKRLTIPLDEARDSTT